MPSAGCHLRRQVLRVACADTPNGIHVAPRRFHTPTVPDATPLSRPLTVTAWPTASRSRLMRVIAMDLSAGGVLALADDVLDPPGPTDDDADAELLLDGEADVLVLAEEDADGPADVAAPKAETLLIQRDLSPYCLRNATALPVAVAPLAATAFNVRTAPPAVRSTTLILVTSAMPKNSATCCWLKTTCQSRIRAGTTFASVLHGSGTLRAHASRAVQMSSLFSVRPADAE